MTKPKNTGHGKLSIPIEEKQYREFLDDIKAKVRSARVRAALSVNSELIQLYWNIGFGILERQARQGWGAKVIDRLAADLQRSFPDMKGFSPRNLRNMKRFAKIYGNGSIWQQAVAKLPWGHNVLLMGMVDSNEQRLWYAQMTLENGWSRDVLAIQVETRLYERQAKSKKLSNFKAVLPMPQSDLAEQTLKDPYIFDFLSLERKVHERGLERSSQSMPGR